MEREHFGISMKNWCRDHEERIRTSPATPELIAIHREKIQILQHERLVHLIVTVMVTAVEMFVLFLVLWTQSIVAAAVMLGLAVLLGFYYYHYFFLENTVQRWYIIADQLMLAARAQNQLK